MRLLVLTPTLAMLMLLISSTGCVRERVVLVPSKGPYLLMEPVEARVGIEDPVGSGKFRVSPNRVEIPAGLTVFDYDWKRRP